MWGFYGLIKNMKEILKVRVWISLPNMELIKAQMFHRDSTDVCRERMTWMLNTNGLDGRPGRRGDNSALKVC